MALVGAGLNQVDEGLLQHAVFGWVGFVQHVVEQIKDVGLTLAVGRWVQLVVESLDQVDDGSGQDAVFGRGGEDFV